MCRNRSFQIYLAISHVGQIFEIRHFLELALSNLRVSAVSWQHSSCFHETVSLGHKQRKFKLNITTSLWQVINLHDIYAHFEIFLKDKQSFVDEIYGGTEQLSKSHNMAITTSMRKSGALAVNMLAIALLLLACCASLAPAAAAINPRVRREDEERNQERRCASSQLSYLGNASIPLLDVRACPDTYALGYAYGSAFGEMMKVWNWGALLFSLGRHTNTWLIITQHSLLLWVQGLSHHNHHDACTCVVCTKCRLSRMKA